RAGELCVLAKSAASANFYLGSYEFSCEIGRSGCDSGPKCQWQINTPANYFWRAAAVVRSRASEWICDARPRTQSAGAAHRDGTAGKPATFSIENLGVCDAGPPSLWKVFAI